MLYLFLILFFSAAGICETTYLIKKRRAIQHPVCFLGHKCEVVLTSQYNKIFLLHNDVWGLLIYGAIFLISGFVISGVGPVGFWSVLLKVLLAGGFLASLVFVYLMWRVIKSWCFWCVMSAVNFTLMTLLIILGVF